MIKRIAAALLAAVCLVTTAHGQSNVEKTYRLSFWHNDQQPEAFITGLQPGVTLSGAVTIPGSVTIDGTRYVITRISSTDNLDYWNNPTPVFKDQTEITSVHIPSTIHSIEVGTFEGCKKLKEFTVNSANKYYKTIDGALYHIRGDMLDLVRFPPARTSTGFTLPSEATYINEGAFADNYTITTLRFGQWQKLSPGAMMGNLGISKFELLDSYLYKTNATGDYVVGSDGYDQAGMLVAVAPRYKMGALLTIPSGIHTFPWKALAGSRAAAISIPSTVTAIYGYAFAGTSFKTVTVPATVTTFNTEGWFEDCPELTSVTINARITEAGELMFRDCVKLTEVNLPTSCKELRSYCFLGCTSLKSFNGLYNFPDTPNGYNFYQFAHSGLESVNLPSNWAEIPQGMFYHCTSLKSVTLSDKTETILRKAFYGSGIETINLKGVSKVGADAFITDGHLRKIVIPAADKPLEIYDYESFNPIPSAEIYIDRKEITGDGWPSFFDSEASRTVIYTSKRSFSRFVSRWEKLYVPAGSRSHYQSFTQWNGDGHADIDRENVFEMFKYSGVDVKGKKLTVTPAFWWVKITSVTINGTEATANGDTWTASKAQVTGSTMNVVISYTANDIKMSTEYNLSASSSIEDAYDTTQRGITIEGGRALLPAQARWSVHDMAGRVCLSGDGAEADLTPLPAGVYVITANVAGRPLSAKIIR